jgi:hypothetical protein
MIVGKYRKLRLRVLFVGLLAALTILVPAFSKDVTVVCRDEATVILAQLEKVSRPDLPAKQSEIRKDAQKAHPLVQPVGKLHDSDSSILLDVFVNLIILAGFLVLGTAIALVEFFAPFIVIGVIFYVLAVTGQLWRILAIAFIQPMDLFVSALMQDFCSSCCSAGPVVAKGLADNPDYQELRRLRSLLPRPGYSPELDARRAEIDRLMRQIEDDEVAILLEDIDPNLDDIRFRQDRVTVQHE